MSGQFVLVVDDEPDIRDLLQEILEDEGYVVQSAGDATSARELVEEKTPDLVLLDIWMPDEDGISLLKSWNSTGKLQFPVIMISGHGTIETAVEATRVGAVDFIEKPVSLAKLLLTVEKALQSQLSANTAVGTATQKTLPLPLLAGDSAYASGLRESLDALAASAENLLVYGQPGSGREWLARNIHSRSAHASGPFVHLRCESLSASNFQRELFGAEINGSVSSGYFESAAHGTLFIDNVEMLPQAAHAAVLEVIDRNDFVRVGGASRQSFTARLITTARNSLEALIGEESLERLLAARLAERSAAMLVLNQRPEDVPSLLTQMVEWHVAQEGLTYRHFTVAAQNRLRNYDWPGNLPELKNLVQRALILGGPTEIDVGEIERLLGSAQADARQVETVDGMIALRQDLPLREARALFEREYLMKCLQESHGNMGELAKHVGMERTHLYRKLRSLDIDLDKARE